jgi:lysophospholipase L1-like esterase
MGSRRKLAVALVLCAVALGGAAIPVRAGTGGGSATHDGPSSIVQLGDSIAAGEGTLYGYTYDAATKEWTGGNLDATWPGPHPLCHDSPYAYSHFVAPAFRASRLTQLACTGATFANGITRPEVEDGTTLAPAQFGNWAARRHLNRVYDAAKPDLVLITLGADDLQFVPVVTRCVENSYEHYLFLADLECVAGNPGDTIRTAVFEHLPRLARSYRTLVSWIQARAEANDDPVPKIVFTTYPDPLPENGERCPDTNYLYPEQVRYLSKLVVTLNTRIESAIQAIDDPGVALADLSDLYDDGAVSHRWCSDDPWAYGLSIMRLADPASLESQAPFHPTPAGQQHVAAAVVTVVRRLFA